MSRAVLNEILNRSLLDEGFRRAVQADPDEGLAGYDLTDDERSTLLSRNFKKASTLAGPSASIFTARFAPTTINSDQLIAIRPPRKEIGEDELILRGAAIASMEGERTEAIKEFLTSTR